MSDDDDLARAQWRVQHRASRQRGKERPPRDPNLNPMRMPLAIRIVFILFGLALTLPATGYFIYAHYRASVAQSWPKAEGQVLSSALGTSYSESDNGSRRSGGSWSYRADIADAYEVGGVRYHGENVWLNGPSTTHRTEEAQAVVDAHPAGGPVSVSYNPDDPADAALVLNRPRWEILFFTGFGLFWLTATYFSNRRIRPSAGQESRLSRETRRRLSCLGAAAFTAAIVGTILYFMFFF